MGVGTAVLEGCHGDGAGLGGPGHALSLRAGDHVPGAAARDVQAALQRNPSRRSAMRGWHRVARCPALAFLLAGLGCDDDLVTPPLLEVSVEQVVEGLTNPVYLTAPANDARLFIVEQPGRIRVYKNGALLPTPFLNIAPMVRYGGEEGLLSVAFDPGYATNGR